MASIKALQTAKQASDQEYARQIQAANKRAQDAAGRVKTQEATAILVAAQHASAMEQQQQQAQEHVDRLTATVAELSSARDALEAQVSTAQAQHKELEAARAGLEEDNARLTKKADVCQQVIVGLRKQQEASEAQAANELAALQKECDARAAQVEQLQATVAELEAAAGQASHEHAALQKECDARAAQVERLQATVAELEAAAGAARRRATKLEADTEVARTNSSHNLRRVQAAEAEQTAAKERAARAAHECEAAQQATAAAEEARDDAMQRAVAAQHEAAAAESRARAAEQLRQQAHDELAQAQREHAVALAHAKAEADHARAAATAAATEAQRAVEAAAQARHDADAARAARDVADKEAATAKRERDDAVRRADAAAERAARAEALCQEAREDGLAAARARDRALEQVAELRRSASAGQGREKAGEAVVVRGDPAVDVSCVESTEVVAASHVAASEAHMRVEVEEGVEGEVDDASSGEGVVATVPPDGTVRVVKELARRTAEAAVYSALLKSQPSPPPHTIGNSLRITTDGVDGGGGEDDGNGGGAAGATNGLRPGHVAWGLDVLTPRGHCPHTFISHTRISLHTVFCVVCDEKIGRFTGASKCVACAKEAHSLCGKRHNKAREREEASGTVRCGWLVGVVASSKCLALLLRACGVRGRAARVKLRFGGVVCNVWHNSN